MSSPTNAPNPSEYAQRALDALDRAEAPGGTHAEGQYHAARAQVYATLEHARQQQLGNRIALATAIREDTVLSGNTDALAYWLHDGGATCGYFTPEELEEFQL